MYTYVRAIAQLNESQAYWLETDLSQVPMNKIAQDYSGAYVVLTHPLILGELTWNMFDGVVDLTKTSETLEAFLVSNGNKTLPVVEGSPIVDRKHAVFGDALAADFTIKASDFTKGDNGENLPDARKPHATLTHAEHTDYVEMHKRMLANVNGFYHRTDANSKGFHIVDANKTRRKSNKNFVGLYSFGPIGQFEIEPITEDMLVFERNAQNEISQVHVKCKNGLCGKKVFIILGGYLNWPDDAGFAVNTPGVLSMQVARYPWAERYFESFETIEMPGVNFPKVSSNPGFVARDYFRSEEFLKAYFTLSQSFMVVVDTPSMIFDREYPEVDQVPFTYFSYKRPRYPLVVSSGKHEVYWYQEEDGVWLLRGYDGKRKHYMFQTAPLLDMPCFDDSLYKGWAEDLTQAFFLKITKETVEVKKV